MKDHGGMNIKRKDRKVGSQRRRKDAVGGGEMRFGKRIVVG